MYMQSVTAVVMIGGALTALIVGPQFTVLQTVATCGLVAGLGVLLVGIYHELRRVNRRLDINGAE